MQTEITLQRLFNTMPNGLIMVGEDGGIQLVNSQVERLFGYGPEELLGQKIELLIPPRYVQHHVDYRDVFFQKMEQRPMGHGRDLFGLRKDGTEFPVEVALTPLDESDGQRTVLCTVVDISERKKAEAYKDELLRELDIRNRKITALYAISELLRTTGEEAATFTGVADAVREGISRITVSGVCLTFDGRRYCDPAFREATFCETAEVIVQGRQRGSIECFHDDQPPPEEAHFVQDSTLQFVHRVAEIVAESIERREAEAKVVHASKLASVGELAAGIGHEINNPINGIINCAEILLQDAAPGSKNEKFLELIRKESERIAGIVASLLAFSRQEKHHYSPARMVDIVNGVLDLSRKRLQKSHVIIDVDLPQTLPRILCRSEQMQQVVMNLILNAAHALDEKYPGSHPDKRLIISAREQEMDGVPFVALAIEDRGSGIAPENRERIFDPFFTTKGRDKGTGLGLSVSNGIVESHGGKILLESAQDEFTRFTVLVPLSPPQSAGETT
jgi:PAS domain S-box-containing protein